MNVWRHIPTGYEYTFVGEYRDADGVGYAVMESDDGFRLRVNPLDFVKINGDWEKMK